MSRQPKAQRRAKKAWAREGQILGSPADAGFHAHGSEGT
jgi:hypothetical protein